MASPRLAWLDWQRGLAVLFMIEVHCLNAWLAPSAWGGWVQETLSMLGGLAAPGFLYMAGLAQWLGDASAAERGVSSAERRRNAVRRGLYVLGVAYVFRVAEYFLGFAFWVEGGWLGIFKVDVLNIIGVSLVLTALGSVGMSRRVHALLLGGGAALVVVLTPFVAARGPAFGGYLYMPGTAGFGLCNWAAFAMAGSVVGALLGRGASARRILALGAGLCVLAFGIRALPSLYPQSILHDQPWWFVMRLGMTVSVSGLLMLLPAAVRGLGWLSLLGRQSLFAYMASVELTYGLLLKRLYGALSLPAAVAGILCMMFATLLLVWALEWAGKWWRARTI